MDNARQGVEPADPRVKAALAEYMERVDRGEPVDRDEFLATHAEIADQLRSFIATSEELARLASPTSHEDAQSISTNSIARRDAETMIPQRVQGARSDPNASSVRVTDLPEQFGRYRILKPLGSGAMGMVYLAQDTQLERQVALKTPSFDEDATGELLERFYREAKSAATLRHSNICPVFDVGEIDGRHYISMAYIEGRPLSAYIEPGKPPAERQVLLILRKLALALQEAHDHGIVHRDLKPGNVMIDGKGEPIIMDFGLARRVSTEGEARLTQSGMLVGSPAYMSPEQVQGDPDKIGPASDQYSLGVILYELLTGRLPFRGGITAVIGQILTKEPTPPSELREGLDPRIEALCRKMMAKRVEERYAGIKEVATEAARILKSAQKTPTGSTATAGSERASGDSKTRARSDGSAAKTQVEAPRPGITNQTRTVIEQPPESSASGGSTAASVTASNVTSLYEAAQKCMRKHDYEQVVQMLETIPEHKRNEDVVRLLTKARQLSDEVQFLLAEIDEALRVNDNETLGKKADELLKLKPGHHKAKQIKEELSRYGGGLFSRRGRQTVDGRRVGEGSWIPWTVIAVGVLAFGVALWGITIYLRSGSAVVRVEINDPDIKVSVQNETITIEDNGQEIRLDPKEGNILAITYGSATFRTEDSFDLIKGDNAVVSVTILDETLAAKFGETVLGEWPVTPLESDTAEVVSSASPQFDADGEWIDLLAQFEPNTANSRGQWTRTPQGYVSQSDGNYPFCDMSFPARPTQSYDLEVGVIFHEADHILVHLPTGTGTASLSMLRRRNELVGWETDGVFDPRNPTERRIDYPLTPGTEYVARVGIRVDGNNVDFSGTIDGTALPAFTADATNISAAGPIQPERINTLPGIREKLGLHIGLGATATITRFRYRLVEDPPGVAGDTWTDLFNGRDLTGWNGLAAHWRWQDGELVGTTEPNGIQGFNTCLCSERLYGDFEAEFEVKLEGDRPNSGLQIRSEITDPENFVVAGPQVDIGGRFWGGLYGELSGGIMKQADEADVVRAVRPNDWNAIAVRCAGKRVTITVNGTTMVDDEFPSMPDEGILGWQLHHGPAMTARFRNVRIRELDLVGSASAATSPADGWTDLFNGRDLTGWTINSPGANVGVEEGAIVASSPNNTGWIATQQQFSDFELELDYKLAPGGNSGVFLRIPDEGALPGGDFLEVQLIDDASQANAQDWQRTGSVYGVAGPSEPADANAGEWHTVIVRAEGPEITVAIDGREINRVNVETTPIQEGGPFTHLKRPSGHIGLQLRRSRAEFRNIRVRELAAAPAMGDNSGVWELQTYTCLPGRLPVLHEQFRNHVRPILERHGIHSVAFWTVVDPPRSRDTLVHLVRHESRDAANAAWTAFRDDPEWRRICDETEGSSDVLANPVLQVFLSATDYSPVIAPPDPGRVYELRMHTVAQRSLPALHDVFRTETDAYFRRHGIRPIAFWSPTDVPESNNTVVYLLEHQDRAAADAAWDAFAEDPEWIALRQRTEASGRLVPSDETLTLRHFLQPTDYSPTNVKTTEHSEQESARESPLLAVAPFNSIHATQHQQEWAQHLGLEVTHTNTIGIQMKLIPPGEFLMGTGKAQINEMLESNSRSDGSILMLEEPQHRVRITQPFYLGVCEVTVGQFRQFVNASGYQTEAEIDSEGGSGWNQATAKIEVGDLTYNWTNPGFPQNDDCPVVNVTWNDAMAFCDWMSQEHGVMYRLPSEAEWEYACRAGTSTLWSHGDDPEALVGIGNVPDETAKETLVNYTAWPYVTARDGFVFTAPVGSFVPNNFGLHDMHGNVWEWCIDVFDSTVYAARGPITLDPIVASAADSRRVLRGGSWNNNPWFTRSARRSRNTPGSRLSIYGFRVAMVPREAAP